MSEPVRFWLDNRLHDGSRVAEIGEQLLVEYGEKYYIVVDGVARMKGSKPLCYSKLSIPTVWRASMAGTPSPHSAPRDAVADDLPGAGGGLAEGAAAKAAGVPPATDDGQLPERPARPSAAAKASGRSSQPSDSKQPRPGKGEPIQLAQEFVEAKCPYCGHRNEIVLDRSRRARPFFVPCDKCAGEFAVKLVQVLAYQAQVAGFR